MPTPWNHRYVKLGERFFVVDEDGVAIKELERTASVAVGTTLIPTLKVSNEELYFKFNVTDKAPSESFYVVHKTYFIDYFMFYEEGIRNVYCIDDKRFICMDTTSDPCSFINTMYSIFRYCFDMNQMFKKALKRHSNTGKMSFQLPTTQYQFQYFRDKLSNASHNSFNKTGKMILACGNNSTTCLSSKATILELKLSTIFDLQPLLGNNYWLFPTGEVFGFGSQEYRIYNNIVPIGAGLCMQYDIYSGSMNVSFHTERGNGAAKLEESKTHLRDQKERLHGKYVYLHNQQYRVVDVSFLTVGITTKSKLIAWLVESPDFKDGATILSVYRELDQLYHYDPVLISDYDIVEAIPARKHRRTLTATSIGDLNSNDFRHSLSDYFYRSLRNPAYDYTRLLDDLKVYGCKSQDTLIAIFIDDLRLHIEIPVDESGLPEFCMNMYELFK